MIGTTAILVSGVVLGAGTFAYRAAGPLLRSQFTPSLRIQALMGIAATVLLVALAATSAVADGREPADLARPIGVLVAGVLAWRRRTVRGGGAGRGGYGGRAAAARALAQESTPRRARTHGSARKNARVGTQERTGRRGRGGVR